MMRLLFGDNFGGALLTSMEAVVATLQYFHLLSICAKQIKFGAPDGDHFAIRRGLDGTVVIYMHFTSKRLHICKSENF